MSNVEQQPVQITEPTPQQIADIVGTVTVLHYRTIDNENGYTLIPDVGKINRLIQNMLWTLVAPGGITFADVPIVFAGSEVFPPKQPPPPLPFGYTAFTGTVTRWDDLRVSVDFGNVLSPGDPVKRYRYDIWVNQPNTDDNTKTDLIKIENFYAALDHVHNRLRKIDPDMENEPKP
jgi:hypothetical protein